MNIRNCGHRLLALLLVAGALAACSQSSDTDPSANQAAAEQARSLQPTDPDLATLYDQTCRNCHTNPASGAPLTGATADWQARLDKGMDQLLDNTINGFRGMPPLGTCMDCSEAEFEALIRFMASGT